MTDISTLLVAIVALLQAVSAPGVDQELRAQAMKIATQASMVAELQTEASKSEYEDQTQGGGKVVLTATRMVEF